MHSGTVVQTECLTHVERRSLAAVALMMLGALGCRSKPGPVGHSEHALPELPANARISMSRTECFGSCPVYDLEIRGDGRVLFTGVAHVRVRDGHQTKQVGRDAVAGLFAEFQSAGFFSWKDGYETPGTDLPTVTTSVTLGPLRKEITDYGPDVADLFGTDRVVREKLAALEHRVDAVSGSAEWARCPDEEDGRCRGR